MTSGPRITVGDRPPGTPEDRPGTVDRSAVRPAGPPPSEPPPPAVREDHFGHVGAPLRVLALVIAAGTSAVAGWMLAHVWKLFSDGLAGRVPMDKPTIWTFLFLVAVLLPMIHRLWVVARRGVDPKPEAEALAAIESRALLEAVERHDRLLEAQRLPAVEAGGVVDAERRSEPRDPRLVEPADRGDQARTAAPLKERRDPG